MKIVFLGTGHGVPTEKRACSAALVEVGGSIYFIDAGAPLTERTLLSGRDITKARAVFTTHSHGDHIGALFTFCDLVNWYYKDMNIDVFMTERSAADAISNLVSSASRKLDTERIRMRIAEAGEVYSDENVKVTYIPTKHIEMLGRPSYAILIEGEGKRVLFSGDLSQKLSLGDFPTEAYGELDLFVLELAHFGLCELDGILPNIGAMHLAFSHVSPIAKYEDIEAIKGKYPFEILTPSDMNEITV